jgi:dTDP-4-amino-4,6-dideoxygalactose transaminase
VDEGDLSTFKDFAILVDVEGYGMDADAAALALDTAGVETRRYYSPPVHRTRAYRGNGAGDLPVTERAAEQALSLPLWVGMNDHDVAAVAEALRRNGR